MLSDTFFTCTPQIVMNIVNGRPTAPNSIFFLQAYICIGNASSSTAVHQAIASTLLCIRRDDVMAAVSEGQNGPAFAEAVGAATAEAIGDELGANEKTVSGTRKARLARLLQRVGAYPDKVVDIMAAQLVDLGKKVLSPQEVFFSDALARCFCAYCRNTHAAIPSAAFNCLVEAIRDGSNSMSRTYESLALIKDSAQLTTLADALIFRFQRLYNVASPAHSERFDAEHALSALGVIGRSDLLPSKKRGDIAQLLLTWVSVIENEDRQAIAMTDLGLLGDAAIASEAVSTLAKVLPTLLQPRINTSIIPGRGEYTSYSNRTTRACIFSLGRLAKYGEQASVLASLAIVAPLVLSEYCEARLADRDVYFTIGPRESELPQSGLDLFMEALSAAWKLVRQPKVPPSHLLICGSIY